MAAWVLGGVRLISSARIMLANSGPGRNWYCRRRVSGSSWMICVPVTSLGIRSGVNWMRLKPRCVASASELTSSVLARPGTPSKQGVAAGEDGDQDLFDDVALADDHFRQFLADTVVGLFAAFDGSQVVGRYFRIFSCHGGSVAWWG